MRVDICADDDWWRSRNWSWGTRATWRWAWSKLVESRAYKPSIGVVRNARAGSYGGVRAALPCPSCPSVRLPPSFHLVLSGNQLYALTLTLTSTRSLPFIPTPAPRPWQYSYSAVSAVPLQVSCPAPRSSTSNLAWNLRPALTPLSQSCRPSPLTCVVVHPCGICIVQSPPP